MAWEPIYVQQTADWRHSMQQHLLAHDPNIATACTTCTTLCYRWKYYPSSSAVFRAQLPGLFTMGFLKPYKLGCWYGGFRLVMGIPQASVGWWFFHGKSRLKMGMITRGTPISGNLHIREKKILQLEVHEATKPPKIPRSTTKAQCCKCPGSLIASSPAQSTMRTAS